MQTKYYPQHESSDYFYFIAFIVPIGTVCICAMCCCKNQSHSESLEIPPPPPPLPVSVVIIESPGSEISLGQPNLSNIP
jgi:hypothetical protein